MCSLLCDLCQWSRYPDMGEAQVTETGGLTRNMPRRESISNVIKGQMLALHEKGLSNRIVAPRFRIRENFFPVR